MNKSSQKVKNWRQRTKERIILAMGGQCVCCGYNKCNWSLALHHLDPSEKDFSLGSIRANCKSWDKIVIELRKCVLICQNCHNEVHHGMTKIPTNHAIFNEVFADYKKLEKIERESNPNKYHPCPHCEKPVPNYQKHCSKSCAASNQHNTYRKTKINWPSKTKINWPSNEELIKMLSQSNYSAIGRKLGVSDNAIRKRLKK